MQRGGSPTCKDRVYASVMGAKAVELLMEGKSNRVVGYRHGEFVDFDINDALSMKKEIPAHQYEISKTLALSCGDVMNGIIYKNSSVSDYTNIAERI
ncbi:6-phosphofructokinase [Dorea longicatena]|nr:6-phosphofructokinase [Dorea longicatena]